jgi:guanylate kinase
VSLLTPGKCGLLLVLSGPSGVGKGTVVNRAMSLRSASAKRLRRSVSVTTRPQRKGEKEGIDYFFRSQEEFQRLVRAEELLEWATYLKNSYGTPAAWVDQQLAEGYDVVLEIEVQGALQVRQHRPEAVLVYMLPPSWRALELRLKRRRSECEETQQQRLAVAHEELLVLPEYQYVIVNDQVNRAARSFLAIIEAEHARTNRIDLQHWLNEGVSGETT